MIIPAQKGNPSAFLDAIHQIERKLAKGSAALQELMNSVASKASGHLIVNQWSDVSQWGPGYGTDPANQLPRNPDYSLTVGTASVQAGFDFDVLPKNAVEQQGTDASVSQLRNRFRWETPTLNGFDISHIVARSNNVSDTGNYQIISRHDDYREIAVSNIFGGAVSFAGNTTMWLSRACAFVRGTTANSLVLGSAAQMALFPANSYLRVAYSNSGFGQYDYLVNNVDLATNTLYLTGFNSSGVPYTPNFSSDFTGLVTPYSMTTLKANTSNLIAGQPIFDPGYFGGVEPVGALVRLDVDPLLPSETSYCGLYKIAAYISPYEVSVIATNGSAVVWSTTDLNRNLELVTPGASLHQAVIHSNTLAVPTYEVGATLITLDGPTTENDGIFRVIENRRADGKEVAVVNLNDTIPVFISVSGKTWKRGKFVTTLPNSNVMSVGADYFTEGHVGAFISLSGSPATDNGTYRISHVNSARNVNVTTIDGNPVSFTGADFKLWTLEHTPASVASQLRVLFDSKLQNAFDASVSSDIPNKVAFQAVETGSDYNATELKTGTLISSLVSLSGPTMTGGADDGLNIKKASVTKNADSFYRNLDVLLGIKGKTSVEVLPTLGILPHTLEQVAIERKLTEAGIPVLNRKFVVMDTAKNKLAGITDLIKLVGLSKTKELLAGSKKTVVVCTKVTLVTSFNKCGDAITSSLEKVVGINVTPQSVAADKVYVFHLGKRADTSKGNIDSLLAEGFDLDAATGIIGGSSDTTQVKVPTPGALDEALKYLTSEALTEVAERGMSGLVFDATPEQLKEAGMATIQFALERPLSPEVKAAFDKFLQTADLNDLTNGSSCFSKVSDLMANAATPLKMVFSLVDRIFNTINDVMKQIQETPMKISTMVGAIKNTIDKLLGDDFPSATLQCLVGQADFSPPGLDFAVEGINKSIQDIASELIDMMDSLNKVLDAASTNIQIGRTLVSALTGVATTGKLGFQMECLEPTQFEFNLPQWALDALACANQAFDDMDAIMGMAYSSVNNLSVHASVLSNFQLPSNRTVTYNEFLANAEFKASEGLNTVLDLLKQLKTLL